MSKHVFFPKLNFAFDKNILKSESMGPVFFFFFFPGKEHFQSSVHETQVF